MFLNCFGFVCILSGLFHLFIINYQVWRYLPIYRVSLDFLTMEYFEYSSVAYPSHLRNSMESGGFISTFSLPTSDQLVLRTVPLDSWKDFIIARFVSSFAFA